MNFQRFLEHFWRSTQLAIAGASRQTSELSQAPHSILSARTLHHLELPPATTIPTRVHKLALFSTLSLPESIFLHLTIFFLFLVDCLLFFVSSPSKVLNGHRHSHHHHHHHRHLVLVRDLLPQQSLDHHYQHFQKPVRHFFFGGLNPKGS
eukprot:Pompholyxophrys_punicea_v1_NODE_200_length_2805_cov_13.133406.p3 type:complete len:150 gc:universal NODE_200_length_2805_cov_13.133406:2202-2651(+)